MKIYLVLGHPDDDSFNGKIARAYKKVAEAKGHEVRYHSLGQLKFDPILWKGYKEIQELEPDLIQAQENLIWCDKWVLVYPVWWGMIPALLKGFLDRTLLPGFAFKYHDNDPFWDKLLKGRKAEIIRTSDAPWWWIWWKYSDSDVNAVKNAILKFCGFSPVKVTKIDQIKKKSQEEKEDWLKQFEKKLFKKL